MLVSGNSLGLTFDKSDAGYLPIIANTCEVRRLPVLTGVGSAARSPTEGWVLSNLLWSPALRQQRLHKTIKLVTTSSYLNASLTRRAVFKVF